MVMPIHRGPEYHESLRLYLHHPAYRVRGMKVASNTKHPCRRRERRLWAVLVVRCRGRAATGRRFAGTPPLPSGAYGCGLGFSIPETALPWACERSSDEVGVGAVYRPRSGRQVRALATGSASVDAAVPCEESLIPAIRAGPH